MPWNSQADIEWTHPYLVLIGFTLVIGILLLAAASTSTLAFGVFNPTWEGTSDLRADAETTTRDPVLLNTSGYGRIETTDSLVLVLAPREPYTEREVDRIKAYLNRGGTVLIAEDFHRPTNRLLQALGAEARIDGRPLTDSRYFYRRYDTPILSSVGNHSLVDGIGHLTFNRGTAIEPGNATVLVSSSEFAYLDSDEDYRLDYNETPRSYPVATIENVSGGQIILLGDPSVFINWMLERPGNAAFENRLISRYDQVYIDASHMGSLPPAAIGLIVLRRSIALQLFVGLLAVGLVIAGFHWRTLVHLIQRWKRRSSETDVQPVTLSVSDIRALITQRHPEWDDAKVERILTGFAQGHNNIEGTDERDSN